MSHGYMGKVLKVDLSKAKNGLEPEKIDHEIYANFLSGYGLASKILFEELEPKIHPLDPENILAVMSGILTGTGARFSGRWMVASKSPLTGTWGDANCGGSFGPAIKQSGYDGFFFKGKSANPVYLLIDGDHIDLIDASDLWGKDTYETEDILKKEHGKDFKVACIGKGGEKQSLIAGIVTDKGRLAARSGLGAVMGSKNLKAICLGGEKKKVEVFDESTMRKLTNNFLERFSKCNSGFKYTLQMWGTSGGTWASAYSGDSPTKNWKGVGRNWHCGEEINDRTYFKGAEYISDNHVTKYERQKFACAECPLGCGAKCTVERGPYPLTETHRPEYETLCAFGTLLLVNDLESIFKANDMLNRAGIDTISCGAIIAWAYEAFENKVITVEDTDGLSLTWGNSESLIPLIQKIIDGQGIGEYLKNGVKRASEHFDIRQFEHISGNRCHDHPINPRDYAIHSGGQELPMHDPRYNPEDSGIALGVAYEVEPTPGRHTSTLFGACDLYRYQFGNSDKRSESRGRQVQRGVRPLTAKDDVSVSGQDLADGSRFACFINGLGLCNFSFFINVMPPIVDWTNAATGWNYKFDEYLETGRRIETVRHAFNLREGIPKAMMTDRARGIPPMKTGPNAGNIPNYEGAAKKYYEAMGWDPDTSKPLETALTDLNLPKFLPKIIEVASEE